MSGYKVNGDRRALVASWGLVGIGLVMALSALVCSAMGRDVPTPIGTVLGTVIGWLAGLLVPPYSPSPSTPTSPDPVEPVNSTKRRPTP